MMMFVFSGSNKWRNAPRTDIVGFTYTYNHTNFTGEDNEIQFDEPQNNISNASVFFIGINDSETPSNNLSTHIDSWNSYGATNNRGIVTIRQKRNLKMV